MTNDEKDQRFAVLLTIAGQARSYFDDALIRVASSEHLSRTDLPDYLLIGMSYLASYQNQALLWCLAKPEASYGAEILARGLLEFLAQTAFVLGKETDSPIGTPEQRAACVSLARAREEYKILYEARDAGAVDRPAGNALELPPADDRSDRAPGRGPGFGPPRATVLPVPGNCPERLCRRVRAGARLDPRKPLDRGESKARTVFRGPPSDA